jgi:hypothetical protein
MFPLDEVYGPYAYRTFERNGGFTGSIKSVRQRSLAVFDDEPLVCTKYTDLVEKVSFFTVMNKRNAIYFRGQSSHLPIVPAIFRSRWKSIGGTIFDIPNTDSARQKIYELLNGRISEIVLNSCSKFPMPRRSTLEMFREAVWSVAQHYELWPTPLIDITPNLRAAASFALSNSSNTGNLYLFAMPPSTNSITFEADQHIVLARLQAVCPPVAMRPHYQDGFLAGRFPFIGPNPNKIDRQPNKVSDLTRRLIARIVLKDEYSASESTGGFWSTDFPRISTAALMPDLENDRLLREFMQFSNEIDVMMRDTCSGSG